MSSEATDPADRLAEIKAFAYEHAYHDSRMWWLIAEIERHRVAAGILAKLDAMYGFHVEGETLSCYDGNNWNSDDLTDAERAYLVAQDEGFAAMARGVTDGTEAPNDANS